MYFVCFTMGSNQWTANEYFLLARAYINVKENTSLEDRIFFVQLTNTFNTDAETTIQNHRNTLDIAAKWYELKTEVVLFNDLYNKIEDDRVNDTEEEILEVAKEEYKSISNGQSFEFEAPWNLLKNLPFF